MSCNRNASRNSLGGGYGGQTFSASYGGQAYSGSASFGGQAHSGSASFGGHAFGGSSSFGGNGASYGGSGRGTYSSQIEQALLNAQTPLQVNESEEITVNGQRGIFLNKQEVAGWRGSQPISSYPINQDSNPQVIRKNGGSVEHVQQVNVRFLKPPSGQAGPIIIRQEPNKVSEPAPPVIIRQQGGRAQTPAPQVFREAPPRGVNLAPKEIVIKGKTLPPPPRKVIIEKLPQQPAKPGDITIDRWLAPANIKRRVIFKPAPNQQQEKPRNVIIEWGPVRANVRQQVNVRGVVEQDPQQYASQYGSQLVSASQLPAIARNVQAPNGLRLAAQAGNQGLVELEGDVQALALVNLEAEGLGEYRQYLNRLGINSSSAQQSFGGHSSGSASFASSANFGSANFGSANFGSSNFGSSGFSSSSFHAAPSRHCQC